MEKTIEYYYKIKPTKIINKNNIYYILANNKYYQFMSLDNTYNEKIIEDINQYSKINILIYPIIKNIKNRYLTIYNNTNFILLEITINIYKKTNLNDIIFLNKTRINTNKEEINWGLLWANKLDYLEKQLYENKKKYSLLYESFPFFSGLCENAISYHNKIKSITFNKVLSHKVLSNSIDSLYNPLNIINDHISRDLAEYIKQSFFNNNTKIFNELILYFKYNFYTKDDMHKLFSRVLYPSFYFNLYDEIILGIKKEQELSKLITLIPNYIDYINNIFSLLNKYYNLEKIDWLNQH